MGKNKAKLEPNVVCNKITHIGAKVDQHDLAAQGLTKKFDTALGISYLEEKNYTYSSDPEEEKYYKKRKSGWQPTEKDKQERLDRNRKLHADQLKEYEDAY